MNTLNINTLNEYFKYQYFKYQYLNTLNINSLNEYLKYQLLNILNELNSLHTHVIYFKYNNVVQL